MVAKMLAVPLALILAASLALSSLSPPAEAAIAEKIREIIHNAQKPSKTTEIMSKYINRNPINHIPEHQQPLRISQKSSEYDLILIYRNELKIIESINKHLQKTQIKYLRNKIIINDELIYLHKKIIKLYEKDIYDYFNNIRNELPLESFQSKENLEEALKSSLYERSRKANKSWGFELTTCKLTPPHSKDIGPIRIEVGSVNACSVVADIAASAICVSNDCIKKISSSKYIKKIKPIILSELSRESNSSELYEALRRRYKINIIENDPDILRLIQRRLKDFKIDPGPIDGIWGPRTKSAVVEIQHRNNIEASGDLNYKTVEILYKEEAKTRSDPPSSPPNRQ